MRDGHLAPQIAMRYLAPAARIDPGQCERMAQVFAQQHWVTRQAADFYNAWRNARGLARARILAEPELFLKTRQRISAEWLEKQRVHWGAARFRREYLAEFIQDDESAFDA
ncbi:MAG: hypothetical protein HYX27_17930 [Acidobacteria bacterium]|nr:hypothetical protein [Acidobacteriota bacterium]